MSQMNLEKIFSLVPMEAVPPSHRRGIEDVPPNGRDRARSRAAEAESFDDHLWRVRKHSEQTTAGSDPDSARLSPPRPAPADATGKSTAQREPADDDHRGDPRDSADAASDENVAAQVSSPEASQSDQAEAAKAETDAQDAQSSETAQAGSPTGQEQPAEADPHAEEVKVVDSESALAELLPEQPHDQAGKGKAGQSGSDSASADQATDSATQTAAEEDSAPRRVSAEDPAVGTNLAEASVEVSDETLGQEADDTGDHNRSHKRSQGAGKAAGQQQRPQVQNSQAVTPLRAQGPDQTQTAADGQAGGQAKEQPTGKPAGNAAENPQAEAKTASNQPATSAAGQTSLVGDRSVSTDAEAAKPAATAAPQNRLNASVRISPGQQPRAGSPQQSHDANQSHQVDQARFVHRVARAFRAIGRRNGSVRLRLSPPELGSLRLEITVRHGLMTARVEAETPAARNLLLDNLPALRDRLAQQDIKVKQFDVDLMGQSPGGLPDQTADDTQSRYRGGGQGTPQTSPKADPDAGASSAAPRVNRPGEGTQLNVII